MRAVLCEDFGLPNNLQVKNISSLTPKEDEVIISVKACGVNFPDTLLIQNLYQFKPELPFSPGGEVAGVIKEVGSKVNKFKVGDPVFALCGWGGFAEEVAVNAEKVTPMAPGMDYLTAASISYNFGTSYHALKDRAKLKQDETLLVLGSSGGVGLAAVQLAKIMGARVIAAASTDEKLKVCKEMGADELINYEKEDLKTRIKELTHGKGADVIYDPVGGKYTEAALRGMAWKGRYLVVGFANGEIPKIPLNLPLLKGCSVQGVFWSRFSKEEPENAYKNLQELGFFYLSGKLKPHFYKIYPLDKAAEALEDLMNRKVIGKAVVIPVSEGEARHKMELAIQKTSLKETPKLVFDSQADILSFVGKELGSSDWLTIDQATIQKFAEATMDEQWIHTDEIKAQESIFGGTIAHGYLTLSLIPKLVESIYSAPFSKIGVNYGLEKVRFVHPVPSGSEIRLKARLKHASQIQNHGLKMLVECTIEIKGIDKPACYAETISVLY
ncbi:MAG: zinc-binding dehydrogenase [Cytophagales bacterium]|nr:zinc-binding dehydrogenase [Cytophagales bacterium]